MSWYVLDAVASAPVWRVWCGDSVSGAEGWRVTQRAQPKFVAKTLKSRTVTVPSWS